jgi:putative transcriptional regulator
MRFGSSTARPLRLAVTAAIAWAALVAPSGAAPPPVKPGVFLYASPAIGERNFAEAVVLLVHHGGEGSMGLIVNRPTRVPLGDAVTELGERRRPELRLNRGGPVEPELIVALVRSVKRLEGARQVLPDVYFSSELRQWKAVTLEPDAESRLRVYAGYAGWSPGQLAEEMRRELWVVGPADAGSVFSADPSALWPRVHQLMRRLEAHGDPRGPSLLSPRRGPGSGSRPADPPTRAR